MKYYIFFLISLMVCFTYGQNSTGSTHEQFVVVLDAGHGGKDPGSQKYGYNEKDIALKVALEVGKNLGKQKNIKVIYTRTTDVFVPLSKRADIANKAHADLFVSIHLNAVDNVGPKGTETFVLGLHRNKDNLAIAMKENSVIYLEDDYKETYSGFDPSSPASYIGMTLMQEEYLDQSILLADNIQTEYTDRLKRVNRGVKKAGLLVLRETYMPSVLTEIGFITNRAEVQYLNSAKGIAEIANAISNGIIKYKQALNFDSSNTVPGEIAAGQSTASSDIVFKVQIGVGSKALETLPQNFKGLKGVERQKEGEVYKYYYGSTSDYLRVQESLNIAKSGGFPEAFLVAYKNGAKISVSEALETKAN